MHHTAKISKMQAPKLGGGGEGFQLCEEFGALWVWVDRDVCLWFSVLLIFFITSREYYFTYKSLERPDNPISFSCPSLPPLSPL